jgi:peptidoglycan-associated lipoprotein
MKRILVGICVAVLVAGCGSKGGQQPPKAAVEQRDVTTGQQPTAEQAAADEAKRKEEEARRAAAAAAAAAAAEAAKRKQEEEARKAAGEPVVRPLPDARVTEKALTDPASALKDPASPLSKRSVYYDFDMYNIREEFQPTVEAHGQFMLENAELRVRIEGNCDERGSREYNLALGQRRADAVKRALTLLGVPANRIETVSFGAEKPRSLGSNEEAWAENRRSDIVYIGIDSPQ